jgi:hypothetical protein
VLPQFDVTYYLGWLYMTYSTKLWSQTLDVAPVEQKIIIQVPAP